MTIEKLDTNFLIKPLEIKGDFVYYDCRQYPFRVFGLLSKDDDAAGFLRMPDAVAKTVSEGVRILNRNTAGGRLKFVTDSPEIHIRATMPSIGRMSHFPLCGSAGFDLYMDDRYVGTFMPPLDMQDGYGAGLTLPSTGEHTVTIHFPLYSDVSQLIVGLRQGAAVKPCADYRYPVPVVYYGSSITQGGCASRPGNAYENIISREWNCDHVNLGFSGNAKGEETMADYIASLTMSVFVFDYDHNAPNLEHLQRTHRPMFERIRKQHPNLPVIMVSRPNVHLSDGELQRRDIIESTYRQAMEHGDKNVYFIDGSQMMNRFGGDSGTVDNCHPNDLGFMCMAKVIGEMVGNILQRNE